MAAEIALTGTSDAVPKSSDGLVEGIRVIMVVRRSAVDASKSARLQIRDLWAAAEISDSGVGEFLYAARGGC